MHRTIIDHLVNILLKNVDFELTSFKAYQCNVFLTLEEEKNIYSRNVFVIVTCTRRTIVWRVQIERRS